MKITATIITLSAISLSYLLATGTSHAGQDPFGSQFENYQCYRVTDGDFDFDKERRVKVEDQFGSYLQFAARPEMICNPVDINGEGIKNPKVHLACFRTDPAQNGGLKPQTVYVKNRFGEGKLLLEAVSQLLCVTTTKEH